MRVLVSALFCLTLAAPALSDETWYTPFGTAIYERDLNDTTILTVPDADGVTMRVYLPGLAGNFDNRSTHDGYWIGDGSSYCPAELIGADGASSYQWGDVILVFDGPAFPTSWTMLIGDCFGAPGYPIRGETTAR